MSKHAAVSHNIFFIDRRSGVGLQTQIRETLVSAVLARRVEPGAALPSTRKLSAYLKISRITVTLAYQELASQGYIVADARSGFRVAETAPVSTLRMKSDRNFRHRVDWSEKLRGTYVVPKQIRKPLDWRNYPFPFLYGQVDTTLFDLNAWRDCARRALTRDDFEQMAGDFAAADDAQLVDFILSRTLPARGIAAKPEEVLITVGAQNGLWIVCQLLLKDGAHAVRENPCHPDIGASIRLCGGRVTAVDVDRHGMPPEMLPSGVDAVFVTPSHHSPTGATMPIERRLALLEAAEERDFIIIEDDYEFEISFLAPPSPALKALDTNGRVIYLGSFSKSLFPGLRLGYLVAPAPVIREARALRSLILRHPPGHLQRTAAYFLQLGHYDAVISRMRSEYHRRYVTMSRSLAFHGVEVAGSSDFGGTSFWLRGPAGTDADLIMHQLRDDGVLVESGSPFFPDDDEPCRFFRMGFSSIPENRIADGIARVAARLAHP